jgi:hypothetical protein
MGNVQFHNSKVLFAASGNVAMHADCCCGDNTGDDCSNCGASGTPAQITVVTSGILLCSCTDTECLASDESFYLDGNAADFNDTFTLDQDATYACLWTKTFDVTATMKWWSGHGCSGTPSTSGSPITFRIDVWRNASTWFVSIGSDDAVDDLWVFSGSTAATSDDCMDGPAGSIANTVSCGTGNMSYDPCLEWDVGYDGSATISIP